MHYMCYSWLMIRRIGILTEFPESVLYRQAFLRLRDTSTDVEVFFVCSIVRCFYVASTVAAVITPELMEREVKE